MSRRPARIVHFVSLMAIIAGLFAPMISLPVLADDVKPPEPMVDLVEQGDGEPTPGEGASIDKPAGSEEPGSSALTAVVPDQPILSVAACEEGVLYTQVVSAPETVGITYAVGAPDANGIVIVTATLADETLYTWAATDLGEWNVSGNSASTTVSLEPCPLPEPVDPDSAPADGAMSVVPADPMLAAECGDVDAIGTAGGPQGVSYSVIDNGNGAYTVEARLDSPEYQWGEPGEGWTLVGEVATYSISLLPCEEPVVVGVMNEGANDSSPALEITTRIPDQRIKEVFQLEQYEFVVEVLVSNTGGGMAPSGSLSFDLTLPSALVGLTWGWWFPATIFSCTYTDGDTTISCTSGVDLSPNETIGLFLYAAGDVCGEQAFTAELYEDGEESATGISTASYTHRECPLPPQLEITTRIPDQRIKEVFQLEQYEFVVEVLVSSTGGGTAPSGSLSFDVTLPSALVGLTWGWWFPATIFSCTYTDGDTTISCTSGVDLSPNETIGLFLYAAGDVCGEQAFTAELYEDGEESATGISTASYTHRECPLPPQLEITTRIPAQSIKEVLQLGEYQFVVEVLVSSTGGGTAPSGSFSFDVTLPPALEGLTWAWVIAGTNFSCSYTDGEAHISCTSGVDLSPHAGISVYFYAAGDVCGEQAFTAELYEDGEESATGISTASYTHRECPNLVLTKSASVQSVNPGGFFNYTIEVSSDGLMSGPFGFSDELPSGVMYVGAISVSTSDWAETDLACTASPDPPRVECNGTSLSAGSAFVTIPVKVDDSAGVCDASISNTASLGNGPWDEAASSLTAGVVIDCGTEHGAVATLTTEISEVGLTDEVEYTLELTAPAGHSSAVSFVFMFPHGTDGIGRYTVYENTGTATCEPAAVSMIYQWACTIYGFQPGPTRFVFTSDFAGDAAQCQDQIQGVVVLASSGWAPPESHTLVAPSYLECGTEDGVVLTKSVDMAQTTPGTTLEYSIKLENPVGNTDTITFRDTLPPGLDRTRIEVTFGSDVGELKCVIDEETGGWYDCEARFSKPGTLEASYLMEVPLTRELCASDLESRVNLWGSGWAPTTAHTLTTSTTVECKIDVAISKALSSHDDIQLINAGDVMIFEITVTNNSVLEAENVAFTDTLPGVLVGAFGLGWTAGPESAFTGDDPLCTFDELSGVLECEGIELGAVGDENTFTVTLISSTVSEIAPRCGEYANTASLTGAYATEEPKGSSTVTFRIQCLAPVAGISKVQIGPDNPELAAFDGAADVAVPGDLVTGGDLIAYHIAVSNTANTLVRDIEITDAIPAGTTFEDAWSFSESKAVLECDVLENDSAIRCTNLIGGTIHPLEFRETRSVVLVVRVNDGVQSDLCIIENSADLAYWTPGSGPPGHDSTGPVVTDVDCQPGIGIEKHGPESVDPGDTFTYTIDVTNTGNTILREYVVTDELDGRLSYVPGGSSEACMLADFTVTCDVDTLAPNGADGDNQAFTIQVRVVDIPALAQCEEAIANTASVARADETGPTASTGNPVVTALRCQPAVEISKEAEIVLGDNDRVDAGDTIRYRIQVTNTGNMHLYDIVVTDDLDGISWNDDLTIDQLAPGETASIVGSYEVTQADIDAGELVNTASVTAALDPPAGVTRVQFVGMAQSAGQMPVIGESVADRVTQTTILIQQPGIELQSTGVANTGDDDELTPGETISFTFTVINTGNVTLTDIQILADGQGWNFEDDRTIPSLAPGDQATLAADYTTSVADAGTLELCVDATASDPAGRSVSDESRCATFEVIAPEPATPPAPGQDPSTPAAAGPETPQVVTSLPETGAGGVMSIAAILWAAIVMMLGLIGMGVRRGKR